MVEVMAEHSMPGGVFVLVADDDVIHAQGYGHTDLERGTPVDAQRTRFDIGSVSKLLTATAVLQQVERGALDLETDVNDDLTGLEIPDTFPEPVTAGHLLTHTAGFGEYYLLGSAAPGPGEADPLAESLARFLPPRVRPPGLAHQSCGPGGLRSVVVHSKRASNASSRAPRLPRDKRSDDPGGVLPGASTCVLAGAGRPRADRHLRVGQAEQRIRGAAGLGLRGVGSGDGCPGHRRGPAPSDPAASAAHAATVGVSSRTPYLRASQRPACDHLCEMQLGGPHRSSVTTAWLRYATDGPPDRKIRDRPRIWEDRW
jgi:hypothetical protein